MDKKINFFFDIFGICLKKKRCFQGEEITILPSSTCVKSQIISVVAWDGPIGVDVALHEL